MHKSSDEQIQGGGRGNASWREDFPFRLSYLSHHLPLHLRKQSPEPTQGRFDKSDPPEQGGGSCHPHLAQSKAPEIASTPGD